MLSHETLDQKNTGGFSTKLQECWYSLYLIHNLNDLLYKYNTKIQYLKYNYACKEKQLGES